MYRVVYVMSKPKFFPTLIKSMFYQANWNTDNMQGTGFTWLIKDLFKRNNLNCPDELCKKNSQPLYFNTNPYLITFILGMFLKECKINGKPWEYSNAYASALAALGDSFFWHSLRPFTFFLTCFIALKNPYFAVIFYLLLYNFFHLGFRFFGFYYGYKFGKNFILVLRRIAFNKWSQVFDSFSTFMSGIALALSIKYLLSGELISLFKAILLFFSGLFLARILKIHISFVLVSFVLSVILILGL